MSYFMQFRELFRRFISKNEVAVLRTFRGIVALLCLAILNVNFNYAEILQHKWITMALAVLCAFVPASAYTLVISLYVFVELLSLSPAVAFVEMGLVLASFLLCYIYRGSHYHNLLSIPAGYQIHIPYAMPMISALYGKAGEAVTVLCGGVLTYYLKSVKEHATQFTESKSALSVSELLMDGMISNVMFYVFLLALLAMYLVVYVIRISNIAYSWMAAVIAGVATEFIILLSGYLIQGRTSQIPWLIGGNLITLLIGLFVSYFMFDLDYARAEKVRFEDDEYFYYVTAVPKVRLEEETKEVKKITGGDPSVHRSRMNYTRHSRTKKRERKGTRV